MCHEPTRRHMRGLPHCPLPALEDCIAANLQAARLTNPAVRCVGVAINTAALDDQAAARLLAETADRQGLPAVHPLRTSGRAILHRLRSGLHRLALRLPHPSLARR